MVEPCTCTTADGHAHALDHNGDHAAACKTTHLAKIWLHNGIRDLYAHFAREAGATVTIEPQSVTLFRGKFAGTHLATMLPKNRTESRRAAAEAMSTLLNDRLPAARSPQEQADIVATANHLAQAHAGQGHYTEDTLRIDLSIQPQDNSPPLWVDVTSRHCSAVSYRKTTLTFLQDELASELVARHNGQPNGMKGIPTPAVEAASIAKHAKYAPLLALAKLEAMKDRTRKLRTPIFLAPAVAHHGELSKDAFNLVERLAKMHRHQHAKAPARADGLGLRELTYGDS